jgi:hypothetical protein
MSFMKISVLKKEVVINESEHRIISGIVANPVDGVDIFGIHSGPL